MSRRRVIVLGGGIAGLSTAYFLARDGGVKVTLVEREPRHDAHSTGRSAEILRVAVDDPVTRALALETDRSLEDPASTGLDDGRLIERSGLVVLRTAEPTWAEDLQRRGLSTRVGAAFLAQVAPEIEVPERDSPLDRRAHWVERGGRIQGARLVASLARGASAAGATILRSAGEAQVLEERGAVRGVRVHGGQRLEADQVVVAAGAWSGAVARTLGLDLPLRTTRRQMFLTEPDGLSPTPPPVIWDDDAEFYIRREGSRWAVSVCEVLDAAAPDHHYPIHPELRARAAEAVRMWIKGPRPPLTLERGWSGFRDLSPDDRPILGPDSRLAGLHWCCGLGGHGMTLSLGVGRASASAVLGRPTELAAQCTMKRFESVPA
ncbi:MAG: FAD-dependent oxidoreductase [Planctomycetota bacterium]|nr:FAD-dependent oxidoreductase [Planctomycetota bacterium]